MPRPENFNHNGNVAGRGKITRSMVMISIVAATAGLLFGYDIGISGVTRCVAQRGSHMLWAINEIVELRNLQLVEARVFGSGGDLNGGGIVHSDLLRWSLECMDTKGYDWFDHDVVEVPAWINAGLTKGCSVETMHAILTYEGVAVEFEPERVSSVIVVSLQLGVSGIYQVAIATWIGNTDHYGDKSDGSHGQC
ncbi:hypothetical protein NE237_016811 [Protea cynaroides]|uniref:Major facilitator superfamily (MFS) profile domain-containing protein n=1 Tax=Protea cynaroides TaxID=273540 RepID=A0A9Q0HIM8_9MAGN|nr:hypothetical protein NE237_016811 [Protea cynaroides]